MSPFTATNKAPGVYIEEVQLPGPISGVGTSTGPARRLTERVRESLIARGHHENVGEQELAEWLLDHSRHPDPPIQMERLHQGFQFSAERTIAKNFQ